MIETVLGRIESLWLSPATAKILFRCGAALAILFLSYLSLVVARWIVLKAVVRFIKRTKMQWDDIFIEKKVFRRLAHLAPPLVIYLTVPVVFFDVGPLETGLLRMVNIYMIVVGLLVIDALLSSFMEIMAGFERKHHVPVRTLLQALEVVVVFLGGIMIVSLFTDKIWNLLAGLVGLTAVLMFVFKDTLLGFVGGIQLSVSNMVARGDWIEMPKYGADGDVIDINLTTVKVQNWDKTISTIPTYALISDSFKNWRGMSESGGRRIKRAIYIDMSTIRFCDEAMLKKFSRFQYISDYLERKRQELAEFNQVHEVDDSELVNGRRLTNVGTFRAYVEAYLHDHPKIHQDMTFLVRQLAPTEHGLPLEIYVFSNDQKWANYEAIQSDIFDHILAVVPEFELRVFQSPAGSDFAKLVSG